MNYGLGRALDRAIVYGLSAILLLAAAAIMSSAVLAPHASAAGTSMAQQVKAIPAALDRHADFGLF